MFPTRRMVLGGLCALAAVAVRGAAAPSEITVQLKMDYDQFVVGERIRAVVDVANASADVIDCRTEKSKDRLVLEVYRAEDKYQFEKASDTPFTVA